MADILFVDDEHLTRKVLREVLKLHKHNKSVPRPTIIKGSFSVLVVGR